MGEAAVAEHMARAAASPAKRREAADLARPEPVGHGPLPSGKRGGGLAFPSQSCVALSRLKKGPRLAAASSFKVVITGETLPPETISARYENFPHARSVVHHIASPPRLMKKA
ncbi:MAG: hypothetical protein ACREDT_12830 [Methylocella sp.]